MKEDENWYPTNFLFSISPDGRIESIKTFGGNAEGDDEAGALKTLFEATLQTRRVCADLYKRESAAMLVSVYADGRFKAFRSSNMPLENWDVKWHKSQNVALMAAFLGDPDSGSISDVEKDKKDSEAEKKRLTVEKMGDITNVRPELRKDWSNPHSPNGATPAHPPEFDGWFGNAKKIPLSIDDVNYKEKTAALIAAGFSFSEEEGELWVRP